jgi:hypothetical protein
MASIRHDIGIDRSAESVWAVVRDSSRLPEWFDGIDSVDVEEHRRTVHLSIGLVLAEELTVDDKLFRFQYSITEGLPEASHLGTVDVLEDGASRSRVVYSTEVAEQYGAIVGPATEAALKGLKALLER